MVTKNIKGITFFFLGIVLGFLISETINNEPVGKKIYQKKEINDNIIEGSVGKIPPKIFTLAELYDNTDIKLVVGEYLIIADELSIDDVIFDSDMLKFIPKTDNGSYTTNPSFEAVKKGNSVLKILKDNNITVNIVISEQDNGYSNELIDLNSGVKESQAIIAKIIDKNKDEAIRIIEDADINFRIVSEDGLYYQLTMDYSPSRINLEIIADKVVNASLG